MLKSAGTIEQDIHKSQTVILRKKLIEENEAYF